MPPGSIKAGKAPAKPVPPTAPGAHEAGLEYGEIAPDIAADNMAAHIGAEPEDMPPPCSASTKRPLTAEAFVRRAVDGTFEADLFALDDIPPKDPPRVRGHVRAGRRARRRRRRCKGLGVPRTARSTWTLRMPPRSPRRRPKTDGQLVMGIP